MKRLLKNFFENEAGATSIEYALIGVIVSVGIIGSLQAVMSALDAMFGKVEDGFDR
ncbi:PilA2 pilus assembly protein [Hyphomicrobium nitrativorans NL23]|uniref:PilA2 pilus assembly protein n=1 Tax=Hyphomicrobium nitrativorans NL23 TaxID=1029756 RepID=V5SBN9_9HYPH|nr:Flp family type IVb pilin [Hyphomicrobium nitrativorans]AHB47948.1 PilA2 pilus assembly protein [Hyphomicrobium nitrativorans NL23]